MTKLLILIVILGLYTTVNNKTVGLQNLRTTSNLSEKSTNSQVPLSKATDKENHQQPKEKQQRHQRHHLNEKQVQIKENNIEDVSQKQSGQNKSSLAQNRQQNFQRKPQNEKDRKTSRLLLQFPQNRTVNNTIIPNIPIPKILENITKQSQIQLAYNYLINKKSINPNTTQILSVSVENTTQNNPTRSFIFELKSYPKFDTYVINKFNVTKAKNLNFTVSQLSKGKLKSQSLQLYSIDVTDKFNRISNKSNIEQYDNIYKLGLEPLLSKYENLTFVSCLNLNNYYIIKYKTKQYIQDNTNKNIKFLSGVARNHIQQVQNFFTRKSNQVLINMIYDKEVKKVYILQQTRIFK